MKLDNWWKSTETHLTTGSVLRCRLVPHESDRVRHTKSAFIFFFCYSDVQLKYMRNILLI